MKRHLTSYFVLILIPLCLSLTGCGGGGSSGQNANVVSGVAATGAPMSGNVYLKDSSTPAKELTSSISADGSFSFDATGCTPPYLLKAKSSSTTLYSYISGPGTANINPITNIIVTSTANGKDISAIYAEPDNITMKAISNNLPKAISDLKTTLQPALLLYGAESVNPFSDKLAANHQGIDHFFDQTQTSITSGLVIIKNKSDNKIFYVAPLTNFTQGVLEETNMEKPISSSQSRLNIAGYWVGTTEISSTCNSTHATFTNLVLGVQKERQVSLKFFNLRNFPAIDFDIGCIMNGNSCDNPGAQAVISGTNVVIKPYSLIITDQSHVDGAIKLSSSRNNCEVTMAINLKVPVNTPSQTVIQQTTTQLPQNIPSATSPPEWIERSQCVTKCELAYSTDLKYSSCGKNAYATSCKEDQTKACLDRKSCMADCGQKDYSFCN